MLHCHASRGHFIGYFLKQAVAEVATGLWPSPAESVCNCSVRSIRATKNRTGTRLGLQLPGRLGAPRLSPSSAVYLWLAPQSSHLHPEASSPTTLLHVDTRVREGLTCLKAHLSHDRSQTTHANLLIKCILQVIFENYSL